MNVLHKQDGFFTEQLDSSDNDLFNAIRSELGRQREEIELIASENIVSRAVLEAQGSVMTLRDKSQEDPRESRAADRGLSYVGLEGNIGCIVNGAGLAMATMDTIKLAGGEPANFLDIGGGATPERVAKAFRLVMSDDNVQAVLVNIFAGINRCDWVAEGVVQALREVEVNVPVIVRLAGTNVEEGQKILAKSGLPIIRATTLMEAAERSVEAWQSDSNREPNLRAIK